MPDHPHPHPLARRTIARPTIARRTLLRGMAGSAALVAAAGLAGMAGCGTRGARQTEASCVSEDHSDTERTLAFSNWPQYLDVAEGDGSGRPTLEAFQRRSGIRVSYTEEINDNNEFFGKIRHQLADCQPIGRDIVVLSDWMAARLIDLGWVQRLDLARLPNVGRNLLPSLRDRTYDPDNTRAIPWQSGLAGLAYNGRVTGEVRTVDEVLTRPDLKGRVTALAEMRDTMGLLLAAGGHDPANFTPDQFDAALEKLRRAVESGQIRRFTGNDYTAELARGDIAACVAWSGDVIQLAAEDQRVRFVAPDSGVMLYSDNMLVPNRATHRANAEALMDYYYEPAVAARLAAYVNYICPVQGAQAEMEKIAPELAGNPLIFPDAAMLARSKVFMSLDEAREREYESKFQQVVGG
ncbi:spermidine/putrescine ABC transporter substrate-binding protein [Micromonospora sp. WMMD1102]|uniref:polyamine ABC transporter substrate-binding protein n=1 Tax=Micromonospora sp. WMMD1102 TaxID=3016105 RepID=UPI00241529F0|nr:spermidine/putrescine ABC transporter substrate-binding protein [Micromonospora sp. WMMD1102]MDG4789677.1 spermidine/putrescine ABC transporter substrate-binding protein [Micromonospora sp. WMMD1102]